MALIIKTLAAGSASLTSNDLYTVPASKSAVVYNIRLVNDATVSSTTNLQVKPSNTSLPTARLYKKDHSIPAGGMLLVEEQVTLGQGDKIQLLISQGFGMHFILSGVERDE
jgi:hypothetical protein